MKKLLFLIPLLFLGFFTALAQDDVVTFKTSVEKINEKEFYLVLDATVKEKWHLYSQHSDPNGSLAAAISTEQEGDFSLDGKAEEVGDAIKKYSKTFKVEETFFDKEVQFKQKITLLKEGLTSVNIDFFGQACKEACILVDESFTFDLSTAEKAATKKKNKLTDDNPILFSSSAEKISDTEYYLVIQAKIKDKWHLYSQHSDPNGSLAAQISSEQADSLFTLDGKALESKTIKKYNKTFKVEETFFDNQAVFKQKITLKDPSTTSVNLDFRGQVCKDACIMADESFSFDLSTAGAVTEMKDLIATSFSKTNTSNSTIKITKRDSLLSEKLKLDIKDTGKFSEPVESKEKKSLWAIFIIGFLGGLIALLTPCVFPMIPLTVSFFTKQSGTKKKGVANALLYGSFIIIIYFLLSLPFHLMDSLDPEILNTISTNVWLNVFFFVIFLFFAGSFFGYYELTLPSSWGNKMDNASSAGGLIGIFFMALTLAIVSFSCTGPILGSLLVGSLTADGGAWQLSAGMIGFGAALSLPFTLFALFPSWLNSLPRSGGWLNTVKVVLGFLEIALALKFLSNADLVEHWSILKREVFLGIWIIIFLGLTIYCFGKIKFPHDSPVKKLSKGRIFTGLLSGMFTIYLIAGLFFHTSLKLLAGFPPPHFYSIYEQESDCPLGIDCFKDWEEGYAFAKENNKPIMIDFTGWACVNCRKMEENVWVDPKVFEAINKYVLISLYVDDRKPLPKEKQFNFLKEDGRLKKIRTVGNKWATFQAINFKTASQPYYILLSPELERLNRDEQVTDKVTYYNWLQEGLKNFEASK